MSNLNKTYNRVIIDSPPQQGFADVLVLSRQVNGIVLVVIMGETTREALRQFKRGILNIQGNILGCVVNKFNLTSRYGYGYYQNYYNYEYAEDSKRKRFSFLG